MAENQDTCLVCHEAIEIFAIGKCDHPICFKCSTRMRALCEQFYCPICRTDLPEVFLMKNPEKFGEMPMRKYIQNKKMKIQFENNTIREKFEQLLEYRCKICKDRYPERSFKALRDHMRRQHTLFYCDLCVELKIFPSERKTYNRQELGIHRRIGDKDDTSYKGHPLCEFCDERYLDNDELYKHLRKDHYYCHFCEADRSQEYFSDYEVLREHFRTDHYLCEEGECINRQFENAFRSEIDLKGHRAAHHGRTMSKQQVKQERTLNIDINLAPRPKPRGRGVVGPADYEETRRGPPRQYNSRGWKGDSREQRDIERAMQASLSTMKDEKMKKKEEVPKVQKKEFVNSVDNFPTLSGEVAPKVTVNHSNDNQASDNSRNSLANMFAMSNNMTVQHGKLGVDDFPTLSGGRVSPAGINGKATPPSSGRNSPFVQSTVVTKPEDFPGLPSSGKPVVSNISATWVTQGSQAKSSDRPRSSINNKSDKPKKSKSERPQTSYTSLKTICNDNDFPSLAGPAKKSGSLKWVKSGRQSPESSTANQHSVKQPVEEPSNSSYPYSIIDRFSPVNVVSDVPTDELGKSKSKKKKQKEITSRASNKPKAAVENSNHKPAPSLKGNSSLDNIANLLLTTSLETTAINEPPQFTNSRIQEDIPTSIEVPLGVPEPMVAESRDFTADFTVVESSKPEQRVKFSIEDDFPGLPAAAKTKKGRKTPPPGFKNDTQQASTLKQPPPGFGKWDSSSAKLPPGFFQGSQESAEKMSKSEGVVRPSIPMSTDSVNFQYTQPEDFSYRNQQLIGSIQAVLQEDQDKFIDFKALSGEFRKREISAAEYYTKCEEILGKDKFANIFPELLALLPDITKQQELLSVYMMQQGLKKDAKEDVLKIGKKNTSKTGAWSETASRFLTCHICRQVLLRKDYNNHASSHSLDSDDFPSLHSSSTSVPQTLGLGSWVKAK